MGSILSLCAKSQRRDAASFLSPRLPCGLGFESCAPRGIPRGSIYMNGFKEDHGLEDEKPRPVLSVHLVLIALGDGALAHTALFLWGALGGWYLRAFRHHGAVSPHQAPVGFPLDERLLPQPTTLPRRPEVRHGRARPPGPRGEAFPGSQPAHLASDPEQTGPSPRLRPPWPASALTLLRMPAFLLRVSPSPRRLQSRLGRNPAASVAPGA